MGRRINPINKIMQKSVGFAMRQHMFFAQYPDFKPDEYCRETIDEQIKLIDGEESEFLEKIEK